MVERLSVFRFATISSINAAAVVVVVAVVNASGCCGVPHVGEHARVQTQRVLNVGKLDVCVIVTGHGHRVGIAMRRRLERLATAAGVLVLLQELGKIGDVAAGQLERVELGQLGVGGHPGQAGLEANERFA